MGIGFSEIVSYSRRALSLVWSTSPRLSVALFVLTLAAGALPAAVAYVGALVVDAVVASIGGPAAAAATAHRLVFELIGLEAVLVMALAGAERGLTLCQSLLRAQLGQRVNVMILEKALTLDLAQFEDSEFYDKLNRARQEASVRPLSLVQRTFALGQNAVALTSYAGLLLERGAIAAVYRDVHSLADVEQAMARNNSAMGEPIPPKG